MEFCGIGTIFSGVLPSAITTSFCVGTFLPDVAVFETAVAANRFLNIFLNLDSSVSYVNSVFDKMVSVFCGGTYYLEVSDGLSGMPVFRLFDPRSRYDCPGR